MKKVLSILFSLLLALSLVSCAGDIGEIPENESTSSAADSGQTEEDTVWADALYTEDTTLGEGETEIFVSVIIDEKTVKFTIKTDKEKLGDALTEVKLVEGEQGPYGLYIKKVNGISAVYETDSAYWSLSLNGEAAVTGADSVDISAGAQYELTYTKA